MSLTKGHTRTRMKHQNDTNLNRHAQVNPESNIV